MRLNKTFAFFVLVLCALQYVFSVAEAGNENELFPGETALQGCRVTLPLTNNKKDEPYCIKAERDNHDKELILVRYNKKADTGAYYHYYLVTDEINGKILFYLQTPEDHASHSKMSVNYNYNPKTDRFYASDCFMEAINTDEKMQEKLVEGTYTGKKIRF